MLVAKVDVIHQGKTHGHGQQVEEVVIPSHYNHYLQENLKRKLTK